MKIRDFALLVSLVLLSTSSFADNKEKEVIYTPDAPAAIGPYSQAIAFKDFVFLAGQIPLHPDGNLVGGDIVQQTQQVMDNIGAVLEAADLDYCDLVMSTVYLADLSDFTEFNGAYGAYFDSCEPYAPPARATVGAAIPRGALLEIAVIAAEQKGKKKGKKKK